MLLFANLDGILWVLRQEMIYNPQFVKIFSLEEQAKLQDKGFNKQEQKIDNSKTVYRELKESLKFTLECYAKQWKLDDYQFPNNKEWQAMCKAIQIRHDITHPKDIKLKITDNDLRAVMQAKEWFGEQAMKPFVDHAIKLNQK